MCANIKICVQNVFFVCKSKACVQNVCRCVQSVCRFFALCAVSKLLFFNALSKCVQSCAYVCSVFNAHARACVTTPKVCKIIIIMRKNKIPMHHAPGFIQL